MQTEAASDLWRQIFERAVARDDAAIYVHSENEERQSVERMATALRVAGWHDAQLASMASMAASLKRSSASKIATSPGVAPWLEGQLTAVATPIRAAMSALGYESHERVALGIDPVTGVTATMTNASFTNEGIVSVSAFLFRWCGLVARAYLRTLELDVLAWSDSPLDPSADRERILRHPNVALYWFRIFASFAATGTHSLAPYQPSSPREVLHFEQIAWAQEFFAVAHEFAHHALGHRSVDADPVQQEFEADSLALYICEGLEFEPFQFLNNPYVRTGAAAILLLRALSILSRVERELGGAVGSAKTHPLVEHRIQKIAVRHALQPKQFRMDKNFNGTVERIMDVVETLVLEFLERGGTETLSSIRRRAKG